MARVCEVTGKGPMTGNNVSHANKKTMPEKMTIMKFDPKARKHVEYKETKLK